jgi:hypothetical protein
MRSGTTFFIAERQVKQITPIDYNSPNSNIYKILFGILLTQTAILAAIGGIAVSSLEPALGNITRNFENLEKHLDEKFESLNETLNGFIEKFDTFLETWEPVPETIEGMETTLGEIATDLGIVSGLVTELDVTFDAFVVGFTAFAASFELFAFGPALLDGTMAIVISRIESIITYFTVGPIGGNPPFINDVVEALVEFAEKPFLGEELVYDGVYSILALIQQNIGKLVKENFVSDTLVPILKEIGINTFDTQYYANATYKQLRGPTYNLIVDQRDTIFDILIFLINGTIPKPNLI